MLLFLAPSAANSGAPNRKPKLDVFSLALSHVHGLRSDRPSYTLAKDLGTWAKRGSTSPTVNNSMLGGCRGCLTPWGATRSKTDLLDALHSCVYPARPWGLDTAQSWPGIQHPQVHHQQAH